MLSIFGQSHSAAIGVVIDGLPAGVKIDMAELGRFMARRAPGQGKYATAPARKPTCPNLSAALLTT